MTAQTSATAEVDMAPASVERHPLPVARMVGAALVVLLIVILEISGRPAGLDPGIFVPIAVVAGVAVGGLTGGFLAALVGAPYLIVYFLPQAEAGAAGGTARLVGTLAASAFGAWIVLLLRDRIDAAQVTAEAVSEQSELLAAFTTRLANEPHETLPETIVRGAAELLAADMAVLTLLDPPSGRHFVRAAHGGSGSPMGVEVVPGVGITGQAIRERRLIVAGGAADAGNVARLRRRLMGKSTAQQMAAMVGLQAGRVIGSLTVGRRNGEPFEYPERQLMVQLGPLLTLAMAESLIRREAEEASPRDNLTGLYNHAYLEAALEQIIALRRRTPAEERGPLSILMFDVDAFTRINERNGRSAGDLVLRSVATLLRQRFRASDIVARVAADSFVVVMNGADSETAVEAASQIKRQVRELQLSDESGERIGVSVSAGCSVYRDGMAADVVLHQIEAALDTAGPGGLISI